MAQYRTTEKIDGLFSGFFPNKIHKLANGQYWLQTDAIKLSIQLSAPSVELIGNGLSGVLALRASLSQLRPNEIQVQQVFHVKESWVNGHFNGWDGMTEYTLADGTRCRQVFNEIILGSSLFPAALLFQSNGAWFLQVDGMPVRVSIIY